MKQKFTYIIQPESPQYQYQTIEIKEKKEGLRIAIQYPEYANYIAFVMLRDERNQLRLQKLLGYGEQILGVANTGEQTSIGGVAGAIYPGTWTLIIGLFPEYVARVAKDHEVVMSITVTDELNQFQEPITEPIGSWIWTKDEQLEVSPECYDWDCQYKGGTSWYRGDFHTHTTLSDGKETVENAMRNVEKYKLDFYVPTEHNLMHTGWKNKETCILPGVEVTTHQGHFNVFGIKKMPKYLLSAVSEANKLVQEKYLQSVIDEVKKAQCLVSINHPFLTEWKWLFKETRLSQIDCMEIVNDPTYTYAKESNDMAIRFLDFLWNDGRRIYGIGGSDSHNLIDERYEGAKLPSVIGDPTTHVFSQDLTPNQLLKAVKQGHMMITRFCSMETEISAEGHTFLPGDKISRVLTDSKVVEGQYKITIRDTQETPLVFLVVNGVYTPVKVVATGNHTFTAEASFEMNKKHWTWVRMEVRDKFGQFLGFVNPVYCGNTLHRFKTYGEAKEGFEGNA